MLKVCMLGGRRCGKTSALASMFGQVVNGLANNYLTIADTTNLEMRGTEFQDSLSSKVNELKNLLSKPNYRTFVVDQKPSHYIWHYRLSVRIPGENDAMYVDFCDVPGEACRIGNEHHNELRDYIGDCDVFLVVVDTPYLMEISNDKNELCNDGIYDAMACVQDIQSLLTEVRPSNDVDAKLLVFVPVKCEKWYNEGNIDQVVDAVKAKYATHIKNASNIKMMSIAIMPIMTAGNIEFVEQREAMLLARPGMEPVRCCEISNKHLRLGDGKAYVRADGDLINNDPDAMIPGSTTLVRPFSWYRVRALTERQKFEGMRDGYFPQNCDQLILHIISFMLMKNDYIEDHPQSLWDRFTRWLSSIFGGVNPARLKNIVNKMRADGVLRFSGDGITYLKDAFRGN